MSAFDLSTEQLKKLLADKGLAQYGNKAKMLQRLLSGDVDKKKPGPKANVPKKKKPTCGLKVKEEKKASVGDAPGVLKVPAPLDAAAMTAMKYRFVGTETSPMTGTPLFVYAKTLVKESTPITGTAKKRKGGAVASLPCDEEEDEEDEDDDMSWACEVSVKRLLKKCRKQTLIDMCTDFGVSTSGTKEKLSEDLGEQLHYETDDEDDEEDDE